MSESTDVNIKSTETLSHFTNYMLVDVTENIDQFKKTYKEDIIFFLTYVLWPVHVNSIFFYFSISCNIWLLLTGFCTLILQESKKKGFTIELEPV